MGWRAALGVPSPYPLGPGSYLRLLSPPAPLCLSWYKGHEREWKGGKSRPVEGTFTGLEDQGKHLLFSGPLSPKQPSEAPGLVLHNFQGPLHLRRSCGHNRGSLWGQKIRVTCLVFPVHMACGTPWGPKLDPPLQTPLSGSFLSIGSESTSYSPIAKVFVLFLSCPLILELGFTLQRLFHIYSDFFHNIPVSFYNLFFIMLLFCPPPSFYFIFFLHLVTSRVSVYGMEIGPQLLWWELLGFVSPSLNFWTNRECQAPGEY